MRTPDRTYREETKHRRKKTLTDDKKMINVAEDDYKALLAKDAAQSTQIEQMTKQLSDSTEALIVIKNKMDAAEREEKDAVIAELVHDSNGKLTVEMFKDAGLKDLYFLKDTLQKAEPKSFVSVIKQREADQNKPTHKHPAETSGPGMYNQSTGRWEGGNLPT
jgi:GTPase involved in cell partitioning and DNA repair